MHGSGLYQDRHLGVQVVGRDHVHLRNTDTEVHCYNASFVIHRVGEEDAEAYGTVRRAASFALAAHTAPYHSGATSCLCLSSQLTGYFSCFCTHPSILRAV